MKKDNELLQETVENSTVDSEDAEQKKLCIRQVTQKFQKLVSKQKVFEPLMLASMIADFAALLVFTCLKVTNGLLISFALIAVISVAIIIVKHNYQKAFTKLDLENINDSLLKYGEVVASILSGVDQNESSIGVSSQRNSYVFKVIVRVGEKNYSAKSDRICEPGRIVRVLLLDKDKAYIVKRDLIDDCGNILTEEDSDDEILQF